MQYQKPGFFGWLQRNRGLLAAGRLPRGDCARFLPASEEDSIRSLKREPAPAPPLYLQKLVSRHGSQQLLRNPELERFSTGFMTELGWEIARAGPHRKQELLFMRDLAVFSWVKCASKPRFL